MSAWHHAASRYATAALKAGISAKVISERLGHASNAPQSDAPVKEVKDERPVGVAGEGFEPSTSGL
jgi:integrase